MALPLKTTMVFDEKTIKLMVGSIDLSQYVTQTEMEAAFKYAHQPQSNHSFGAAVDMPSLFINNSKQTEKDYAANYGLPVEGMIELAIEQFNTPMIETTVFGGPQSFVAGVPGRCEIIVRYDSEALEKRARRLRNLMEAYGRFESVMLEAPDLRLLFARLYEYLKEMDIDPTQMSQLMKSIEDDKNPPINADDDLPRNSSLQKRNNPKHRPTRG